MLDDYIISNYDRLKDIAYNMAGSKEHEEFLHFINKTKWGYRKERNAILCN